MLTLTTDALIQLVCASTHTAKYCVPVNLFVYIQKTHFCQCILCFDLEAKTDGENNGKLVFLENKSDC
jgi:hypothetical protein